MKGFDTAQSAERKDSDPARFKELRKKLLKAFGPELTGGVDRNSEAEEFAKHFITPLTDVEDPTKWPPDFKMPSQIQLYGRKIRGERFSAHSIAETAFIRSKQVAFPETPLAFVVAMCDFLENGTVSVVAERTPLEKEGHTGSVSAIQQAKTFEELTRVRADILERGVDNISLPKLATEMRLRSIALVRGLFATNHLDVHGWGKVKQEIKAIFADDFWGVSPDGKQILSLIEEQQCLLIEKDIRAAPTIAKLNLITALLPAVFGDTSRFRRTSPLERLIEERKDQIFRIQITGAATAEELQPIAEVIRSSFRNIFGRPTSRGQNLLAEVERKAATIKKAVR